jgi:hypothetical protein
MKQCAPVLLAVLAVFMVIACATTITEPVAVSANPIGSKVGIVEESVTRILGILPFDYTLEVPAYKAAQAGGITRIATVDLRKKSEPGFLTTKVTYTTIVTGE